MFEMGAYMVNGKPYEDKIQAILEANKTLSTVSWSFHREYLNTLDWTKEPEASLTDIYALRAQQIRDKFDYVAVMCSGGSDSTNVIHSFLDNGIFVDEVIASAPLSGLGSWDFNDNNTSAMNAISEIKYAQMPLMEKIRLRSPKTRLTLNDYFPLIIQAKPDEWMYGKSDGIHPSAVGHFNLEQQDHLKDIAESGKKVAIVFGFEKPYLMRKNGTIVYLLLDVLNLIYRPFKTHYDNVKNIPFYIAHDFPQLMIKQAHVLAKWLFKPENSKILLSMCHYERDKDLPATQRRVLYNTYDRGIRSCLYPTSFDSRVFQTNKISRLFYADMDHWFSSLHGETKMYKDMLSEFTLFANSIDRKYFNNDKTGFIAFGNDYTIGPESQFR